MKITYSTGLTNDVTIAQLTLENVGVNKFRVSVPVQDGAGHVVARTAEIEAASERTKTGTMRVMLKCTIPYLPQMIDDEGNTVIDSTKSSKPYTLHIVHTIPAIMANDALNHAVANQVAQVISLASQIISLGIIPGRNNMLVGSDIDQVPLQTGALSVDGVASYPLVAASKASDDQVDTIKNIDRTALAGSLVGRALVGLMPIDINTDKTVSINSYIAKARS